MNSVFTRRRKISCCTCFIIYRGELTRRRIVISFVTIPWDCSASKRPHNDTKFQTTRLALGACQCFCQKRPFKVFAKREAVRSLDCLLNCTSMIQNVNLFSSWIIFCVWIPILFFFVLLRWTSINAKKIYLLHYRLKHPNSKS